MGNSGDDCVAVQSVLTHNKDPDVCFAGAARKADLPNWLPLTDFEGSLSVEDTVFGESNMTRNTVLVGIGNHSYFALVGGKWIGLLYTKKSACYNSDLGTYGHCHLHN